MANATIDPDRALVLSLKPRFAEAILTGDKTVELRRILPHITIPTHALLYATGPARSLVGTCVVRSVARLPADELWQRHGADTALTRPEFDAYLAGRSEAAALFLEQAQKLPTPIPLRVLRQAEGFRPPQSFMYVRHDQRERFVTALH